MSGASDIVVARLSGGLGNQLFQYAAACGIAHVSGGVPALDLSSLSSRGRTDQVFDRAILRFDGTTLDPEFRVASVPQQGRLGCLGIDGGIRLPVYRENSYEFDPAVKSIEGGAYLYGFWQSWKYFSEIADELRVRLKSALLSGLDTDSVVQAIGACQSVAVHVRRGDYLDPNMLDHFGVCEPAYYAGAMDLMRDRVANPRFFIFSDDPDWARAHFGASDVTVVSSAARDARADLAAMASCRSHILANSSFSWWGAWLGAGDDSIVIAPMPWYTESPRVSDLIPAHWIRLNRRSGVDWSTERGIVGEKKVSAVVLAKGAPQNIQRTLASIRSQTYRNVEIIIAACDARYACSEYANCAPGTTVIDPSRSGLGAGLAAGTAVAQGEWVAFLDDCDIWLPDKLQIQLETAYLTDAAAVSCRTIPMQGPLGLPPIFPPPGPPDCSLQKLLQSGHFISGISHMVVRHDVLRTLGEPADDWTPYRNNDFSRRLMQQTHPVMLWERLVESPIPFLASPERQPSTS